MERVQYKGHVIQARPFQLADSGRWSLDITIERDTGDEVIVRPFSASNEFENRDEAVRHCINFGRQIIDGEVPGCAAP
jgi:hypothetical protein